jgi:hypothetical protein
MHSFGSALSCIVSMVSGSCVSTLACTTGVTTTDLSEILKVEIPEKIKVFQVWVPEKFCVPDEGFQMHGGGKCVLVRNNRFM